jgi:hypothetical protein
MIVTAQIKNILLICVEEDRHNKSTNLYLLLANNPNLTGNGPPTHLITSFVFLRLT